VLIEDPAGGLMRYCADALGVTCQEYVQAREAVAGPFQEGRFSEQEFWLGLCRRLARPVPSRASLWGDAFRAVYTVRPAMLGLLGSLRQRGCKTGLLSNTEEPCVRYFQELRYDRVFDAWVFSCREGVTKPNRRIYDLAIGRLGVARDRAVFIDDNPLFVSGAVEAGLHGIVFRDMPDLMQGLAGLGVS
jgi:FMN phosphatase YigB (HAD superfamily)